MNDNPMQQEQNHGPSGRLSEADGKQLNEWKAQTKCFEAGAENIEAHNKGLYDRHLEILRVTQADAWERFTKLKSANGSTWSAFKAHMEKADQEVQAAVDSMTTRS
jgi:hypothetical protein